jgi:uncharacterized protein YjlB
MKANEALQNINIIRHLIADDGTFPNNGLLPLLAYQKALELKGNDEGKKVIDFFETNGWVNAWENGVYDYHHYHSTAHEVLGIIQGSARIQFGGPGGIALLLEKGDVVVIPAGVAHKALDTYDQFKCVGAYPVGQKYDLKYGKSEEREKSIENIKGLPLPDTDPVYGIDGPLIRNWKG